MQNKLIGKWTYVGFLFLLLSGWLGGSVWEVRTASAQNKILNPKRCRPKWRQSFKKNFRKEKLLDVVKWIAAQTCYNFIISSRIRAQRVTIITERKVRLRQLYRAFLSTLENSSITTIRAGRFIKLIYSRSSAQQETKTYLRGRFTHPSREEMVTYLLRIKYVDIYKMANILNQLSPSVGRRITFPQSGVIILIDYASNIHRLLRIVRALDVAEAEERDRMFLIQIENGQAQEIVQKIQSVFQIMTRSRSRALRLRGQPVDESHRLSKILSDERTNRIILVGSYKAYVNASKLIKELDVPLSDGGRINVHHLRYAKADEVAQTLSQLARGGVRKRTRRRAGAGSQSAELFRGEVRITADKATNSLVIVSNQRDYNSLMRVISQLDVRRKQVFVEAVILEVSIDKSKEVGAAFHGGAVTGDDPQNPNVALFGTRLAGLNSLILDPSALMGLALGLRGPEIPNTAGLLGSNTAGIPSFGVVLRAIQTNSDVDIISTPHILTAANEEATLQVGQNVPFIAGTSFSAAGLGVSLPVRNIQRQDVALTLKIKPQINASNRVKLEMDLEITEIAAQNPELGPTTTKRKIKTTIRVKDKQTVVLGGLMRDRISEGVSKVPFLGDIPLLGALFRVKTRKIEKSNLLIFLTPHIITKPSDFHKIFVRKMKERQEFMRAFYTQAKLKKSKKAKYRLSRQGMIDRILNRYRVKSSKNSKKPATKSSAKSTTKSTTTKK